MHAGNIWIQDVIYQIWIQNYLNPFHWEFKIQSVLHVLSVSAEAYHIIAYASGIRY